MVIPLPVHIGRGAGVHRIGPGGGVTAPPALARVAAMFVAQVAADGGPELVLGPQGTIRVELVDRLDGEEGLARPAGRGPSGRDPFEERSSLRVSPAAIVVSGVTPEGVHRGLTTLRQLIATGSADGEEVEIESVDVLDVPRFAWRGLLVDVARVELGPDAIRTVIDQLDLYKLNVLHLHLTDNEAWRIAVDGHPQLTAGGPHLTQAQFRDLVAYATERFVTVVPEVDLPGHSAALLAVYPELGQTVDLPGTPAAFLDPTRAGTMPFVSEVFGQLADLVPSTHLHIGGDETFGMDQSLYTSFVSEARRIVRDLGRTPVAWQESSVADLEPGDVVQHWIDFAGPGGPLDRLASAGDGGSASPIPAAVLDFFRASVEDVPRALAGGADVIMSPTGQAYFDTRHADPCADEAQEEDRARLGFPFYRPRGLEHLYAWDPGTAVDGCDEARVLGVEAAIWGETLENVDDLQLMVTSRLPGLAERAWSPAGAGSWDEYRGRLAEQAPLWRRRHWSFLTSTAVDWR